MTFPEPYGRQVVHLAPHPEPVTLPRWIDARTVVFKVGYPPDETRRLRALLELRLHRRTGIEHQGKRIVPRDFMAQYVGSQSGSGPQVTANVKRVVVEGSSRGEKKRLTFDFAVEAKDRSASAVITGAVAAISVDAISREGVPGVWPPEAALDPGLVLSALTKRGFRIRQTVEEDLADP